MAADRGNCSKKDWPLSHARSRFGSSGILPAQPERRHVRFSLLRLHSPAK
jgi:hypothetical protein